MHWRTSMCMKRPQSFSNCTVLYNLPKYQSPINSTVLPVMALASGSLFSLPTHMRLHADLIPLLMNFRTITLDANSI
eukprot:527025-Amphidinium_carterae.1